MSLQPATTRTDTHVHLVDPRFAADLSAVLDRAAAAGVTRMITPATCPDDWAATMDLADGRVVFPALGLHPMRLAELDAGRIAAALDALPTWLSHPGIVAVGECGLDTRDRVVPVPLEAQVAVLRVQLALARERDLPVILHVVGPAAHDRVLQLLRADGPIPRGGVVHAYSGGAERVDAYVTLGLSFGLGGTFTRPGASRTHAAARAIPHDRLLLETDAPDLRPWGVPDDPAHPGRCEPAHLAVILERLAVLRDVSPEALACQAEANAQRLFRLPAPTP